MKKLILLFTLAASFSSHAAQNIQYLHRIFAVVQTSDEFTEEVTLCQFTIGEWAKNKPRISFFSRPVKELSFMIMSGHVGKINGSGYQLKIDDGDIIQKGSSSSGGDTIYGDIDASILGDLANGNQLILRVYPEDKSVHSATEKYDLTGSSIAITKFKNCLLGK